MAYKDDFATPEVLQYRQKLENAGFDTTYISNAQLLQGLVSDNQAEGGDWDTFTEKYGQRTTDFYLDKLNAPEPGREGFLGGLKEMPAGFGRGFEGLKSTFYGAGGLAAGSLGFEGIEEAMLQRASDAQKRASEGGPSIARATDVRWDRPGEVLRFLSGGFGEAAPSALEAAGAMAVGAGAGGLIGRQVLKSKIKDAVAGVISKKAVNETAEQAIKRTFTQMGAMGGVGVSSLGMNIGEIYSELYPYTKLSPGDPDYIGEGEARGLALSFGSLAGALDFVSAGKLLSRLTGVDKMTSETYLKRLIKALPQGVFLEGTTEAAQEFIIMASKKYGQGRELEFTPDELNRMVDAGVLGAIGGTQFAAVGAIDLTRKTTDTTSVTDDTQVEEEFTRPKPEFKPLDITSNQNPRDFKVGEEVDAPYSGKIKNIEGSTAIVETIAVDENGDPFPVEKRVRLDILSRPIDKPVDIVEPETTETTETTPEEPAVETTADVKATVGKYNNYEYDATDVDNIDQFNESLEKITKEYERRAGTTSTDGITSKHKPSPRNTFNDIVKRVGLNVSYDTKLGKKVLEILRETGVLNQSNNFAKDTALDKDIDRVQIEDQKAINRDRIITWSRRTLGIGYKTGEDNTPTTEFDQDNFIGQQLTPKEGSGYAGDWTITGVDLDRGNVTISQTATFDGNVIRDNEVTLSSRDLANFTKKKVEKPKVVTKTTTQTTRTKTPNEEVKNDPDPVSNKLEDNKLTTFEEAEGDTYYWIPIKEDGSFGNRSRPIKGDIKEYLLNKTKKGEQGVLGSKLKKGYFEVSFDTDASILNIGEQGFEITQKLPEDDIVVAEDATDFLVNAGALTGNVVNALTGNVVVDPTLESVISSKGTVLKSDEDAFNALTVGTFGTQNKTKKLVILRKGGQLRISTLTGDFSAGRSGVLKFYDSVLKTKNGKPAKEKTRPLRNSSYMDGGQVNSRPANLDGWEVVGVINTSQPSPNVDLIVTPEQLANDSVFSKKIKGFENGLPVPDESRMQKMAQAEMDRAYAADAMLTKLENEKMELIDRQLAGEDVEKELQSIEREIAEYKESLDKVLNKTFKLKGQKEEYAVKEVLAGIRGVKEAELAWEKRDKKATKGQKKEDFVLQYMEDEGIQSFPKEVKDEALRIQQKAIKQSDQSMASGDVAETQTGGFDRDSNRDEAGSEDIGELQESMLNDSSNESVGGVTSRAEGGDLIYAKDGKAGYWPSKDTGAKQGRLDPQVFSLFLERQGLSSIFRVLTDAKSDLQSHNGLDDRLHGKGMSDAHKVRVALEKKIRQIETYLGTAPKEIRSKDLKHPNTIKNLDARLTTAEKELGREIYDTAVQFGVVAPYQKKTTTSRTREATQADVQAYDSRVEELVLLSTREQDPAKQKEIADILARLEPINVGDKIDIPAGTLVPTDPTDPQISQGMDTLVEEVARLDSAGRSEVKGISDDFLGLPSLVIDIIKEGKRALDPRRLTEIGSAGDSPLTGPMLAVINDSFPGNKEILTEYIGPFGANRRDFQFGAFLKDGLIGNNYEQVQEILDHIQKNFFNSEEFTKSTNNEVRKAFKSRVVPMLHAMYGLNTDGQIIEEIKGHEGVINYKMFALDMYRFFGPAEYKDDSYVDISSREVTADIDSHFMMTSLAGFGLMDPTTNQNVDTPMIIVDDKTESLEMQRARNMIGAVASEINPMESLGMTENLQQGRAAQDRFGKPEIPFSGRAAVSHILKNIKSDFNNAEVLDYVARVLQQSNFMDTVKVRFAPWEKFRQYAQSNGDAVSSAVYLSASNEILISDIFYTDNRISADEQLYATILHELIHAPTRTALDVGFAHNNGIDINNKVGNILDMKPGMAEEMGKIYSNIKDVIIPAVTLSNESQSVELTHALSSPHEFMASLTGPQLVEALKRTKLSEQDRRKLGMGKRSWIRTAWDAVKTFLLRMIGFNPTNTDALEYAMDQLDRTVELAQGLASTQQAIAQANVSGNGVLDMLVGIKGASKLNKKTHLWYDGSQRAFLDLRM